MNARTDPIIPRVADFPVDDMFTARWSPRAFGAAPITETELLSLLEAARWAPSSQNLQPWRFVYALQGDPAWAGLVSGLAPSNQIWAQHAAALVVVASKTTYTRTGTDEVAPNGKHAFDTGTAWGFFALQAHMSGWATHAMGGFEAASIALSIQLPDDHALHAVVAVGRHGDPTTLPEPLRSREIPSLRQPLDRTAFAHHFPAESDRPSLP